MNKAQRLAILAAGSKSSHWIEHRSHQTSIITSKQLAFFQKPRYLK